MMLLTSNILKTRPQMTLLYNTIRESCLGSSPRIIQNKVPQRMQLTSARSWIQRSRLALASRDFASEASFPSGNARSVPCGRVWLTALHRAPWWLQEEQSPTMMRWGCAHHGFICYPLGWNIGLSIALAAEKWHGCHRYSYLYYWWRSWHSSATQKRHGSSERN